MNTEVSLLAENKVRCAINTFLHEQWLEEYDKKPMWHIEHSTGIFKYKRDKNIPSLILEFSIN